MFDLNLQPVSYLEPWRQDLEIRLDGLIKGEYRIAYYYPRPDSSTFRYRVYNVVSALQQSENPISAAYFSDPEIDALIKVLDKVDMLVLCRAQYDDRIAHLVSVARNLGKTLVYDIDDLVFDTRYVHQILSTIGADISNKEIWPYWFGDLSRYGAVMSLCDRMTTTNDFLAGKIREFTGKPVKIIPNFLNHEQLDISDRIYQRKKEQGFAGSGTIYMGYFSGTSTHNLDFAILSDILVDLFREYNNLKLRIVGYMELEEELGKYKDRIEFIPFQDFMNLQRSIGQVEINLIPLQDNDFTNSKSELKYFEAGIVGTVSIASPTFVYKHAIDDGQNGYLAKSFEWGDKIAYILDHPQEYARLAVNARQHTETNYSCEAMTSVIEEALAPV